MLKIFTLKSKQATTSFFVLFWLAITLLSSCHTRKGLDAYFEIPFQKSLNVSKAQVQQQECSYYSFVSENVVLQPSNSIENHSQTAFDCLGNTVHYRADFSSYKNVFPIERKIHLTTSSPPYYILYKHFKVPLV